MSNTKKTKSEETSEKKLTQDETAKRRAEITKFYKNNLPQLKVQLEYEELLTKIEKTRVERIQAQMFLAQAYSNPEEESTPEANQAKKEFDEAAGELKQSFRPLKTN